MKKLCKTDEEKQFDILVGRLIQEAREARGMRSGELAAAVGITSSRLYHYEVGNVRCSPYRLELLALALNTRVELLIPKIQVTRISSQPAQ